MTLAIIWTHGAPRDPAADEARAIAAAQAVLGDADPAEAHRAYEQQLAQLGCDDGMTGLAELWRRAGAAADVALTDGWHDPEGASCTLVAR